MYYIYLCLSWINITSFRDLIYHLGIENVWVFKGDGYNFFNGFTTLALRIY
jgi:hypothetical protein